MRKIPTIPGIIFLGCVLGIALGIFHKAYYEIMGWWTALSMTVGCIALEIRLKKSQEDK